MKNLLFSGAAALVALASPAVSAELPRRASLGLAMVPAAQAGEGVALVDQVLPGQTAAALGVRKGDIILEAGGQAVNGSPQVIAYAGKLVAGDQVALRVKRDGKVVILKGKAIGRPKESYSGGVVDYGAVPFRGGHLRDLLVMPAGVANPPVVFLIQGFTCASIEPPDPKHSYRRFGQELLARGIAYYRVEKPGIGDSKGTPACAEIDFATELEAFRSAYNHLVDARRIDADRIFMFGHSLGGIQAPLLAADRPPRGVAAYGTVVRNWGDYHHDLDVFQSYLFYADDLAESVVTAERNREMLRRYYFERQSPAEIAAANPALAEPMRGLLGWDGGTRALGRHYKFMQDIAHQPVLAAWRKTRSNVLSIYGESDVVALFDTDHKIIADIANWYRPGSGRYVEVPGTDHAMTKVGNRFELREKTIAAGRAPAGDFNPEVVDAVAAWIKEAMARPPVRTLPERAVTAAATAAR